MLASNRYIVYYRRMHDIPSAIDDINHRIKKAQHHSPDAQAVTLMAVSKNHSVDEIRQAYSCGIRHFGENRAQEGIGKIVQLKELTCQWHFIGPIQANKTQLIAQHFDWIHSVDRLKILQRLNQQRSSLPPLNVCIQVNISNEPQKSGLAASELPELLAATRDLDNLQIRGLMCIPQATTDIDTLNQTFQQMHALYLQNAAPYQLDTLSMGMSQDLEAAVQHGSTMVRVGRAIFG